MTDAGRRSETRNAIERLSAARERSKLHPPVDAGSIAIVNGALMRAGYAGIPADYAFLLTLAGGIQGPYCTLLGLGSMSLAGGGIERGIHQESDAFHAGSEDTEKLLVLGHVSGDVKLVFATGGYRLIDAQTRDVLRAYDGVADFITDMIELKESLGAARPGS